MFSNTAPKSNDERNNRWVSERANEPKSSSLKQGIVEGSKKIAVEELKNQAKDVVELYATFDINKPETSIPKSTFERQKTKNSFFWWAKKIWYGAASVVGGAISYIASPIVGGAVGSTLKSVGDAGIDAVENLADGVTGLAELENKLMNNAIDTGDLETKKAVAKKLTGIYESTGKFTLEQKVSYMKCVTHLQEEILEQIGANKNDITKLCKLYNAMDSKVDKHDEILQSHTSILKTLFENYQKVDIEGYEWQEKIASQYEDYQEICTQGNPDEIAAAKAQLENSLIAEKERQKAFDNKLAVLGISTQLLGTGADLLGYPEEGKLISQFGEGAVDILKGTGWFLGLGTMTTLGGPAGALIATVSIGVGCKKFVDMYSDYYKKRGAVEKDIHTVVSDLANYVNKLRNVYSDKFKTIDEKLFNIVNAIADLQHRQDNFEERLSALKNKVNRFNFETQIQLNEHANTLGKLSQKQSENSRRFFINNFEDNFDKVNTYLSTEKFLSKSIVSSYFHDIYSAINTSKANRYIVKLNHEDFSELSHVFSSINTLNQAIDKFELLLAYWSIQFNLKLPELPIFYVWLKSVPLLCNLLSYLYESEPDKISVKLTQLKELLDYGNEFSLALGAIRQHIIKHQFKQYYRNTLELIDALYKEVNKFEQEKQTDLLIKVNQENIKSSQHIKNYIYENNFNSQLFLNEHFFMTHKKVESNLFGSSGWYPFGLSEEPKKTINKKQEKYFLNVEVETRKGTESLFHGYFCGNEALSKSIIKGYHYDKRLTREFNEYGKSVYNTMDKEFDSKTQAAREVAFKLFDNSIIPTSSLRVKYLHPNPKSKNQNIKNSQLVLPLNSLANQIEPKIHYEERLLEFLGGSQVMYFYDIDAETNEFKIFIGRAIKSNDSQDKIKEAEAIDSQTFTEIYTKPFKLLDIALPFEYNLWHFWLGGPSLTDYLHIDIPIAETILIPPKMNVRATRDGFCVLPNITVKSLNKSLTFKLPSELKHIHNYVSLLDELRTPLFRLDNNASCILRHDIQEPTDYYYLKFKKALASTVNYISDTNIISEDDGIIKRIIKVLSKSLYLWGKLSTWGTLGLIRSGTKFTDNLLSDRQLFITSEKACLFSLQRDVDDDIDDLFFYEILTKHRNELYKNLILLQANAKIPELPVINDYKAFKQRLSNIIKFISTKEKISEGFSFSDIKNIFSQWAKISFDLMISKDTLRAEFNEYWLSEKLPVIDPNIINLFKLYKEICINSASRLINKILSSYRIDLNNKMILELGNDKKSLGVLLRKFDAQYYLLNSAIMLVFPSINLSDKLLLKDRKDILSYINNFYMGGDVYLPHLLSNELDKLKELELSLDSVSEVLNEPSALEHRVNENITRIKNTLNHILGDNFDPTREANNTEKDESLNSNIHFMQTPKTSTSSLPFAKKTNHGCSLLTNTECLNALTDDNTPFDARIDAIKELTLPQDIHERTRMLEVLIGLINDDCQVIVGEVMSSLPKFEKLCDKHIDAIFGKLYDNRYFVRLKTAKALFELGYHDDKRLIKTLFELVDYSIHWIAQSAAQMLIKLGFYRYPQIKIVLLNGTLHPNKYISDDAKNNLSILENKVASLGKKQRPYIIGSIPNKHANATINPETKRHINKSKTGITKENTNNEASKNKNLQNVNLDIKSTKTNQPLSVDAKQKEKYMPKHEFHLAYLRLLRDTFDDNNTVSEKIDCESSLSISDYERHGLFGSKVSDLERVATNYGFDCRNVDGDGNCFFYSIADQLNYSLKLNLSMPEIKQLGKLLRKLACEHIANYSDIYEEFIPDQHFSEFLQINRRENEWANDIMITALCYCLNVNLAIIRDDNRTNYKHLESGVCDLFVGYQVGLHYQSLHSNSSQYKKRQKISEQLKKTTSENLNIPVNIKNQHQLKLKLTNVLNEYSQSQTVQVEINKGFYEELLQSCEMWGDQAEAEAIHRSLETHISIPSSFTTPILESNSVTNISLAK